MQTWAKGKADLLKEERKALKNDDPAAAKDVNFRRKQHERNRPIPKKRERPSASGTSPESKFSKIDQNPQSKVPLPTASTTLVPGAPAPSTGSET